MSKTDETIMRTTIAQRMAETREQILSFARNPGLTGISRKDGVASLEAALDDMIRNVAIALTSTEEDYASFCKAADATFFREVNLVK